MSRSDVTVAFRLHRLGGAMYRFPDPDFPGGFCHAVGLRDCPRCKGKGVRFRYAHAPPDGEPRVVEFEKCALCWERYGNDPLRIEHTERLVHLQRKADEALAKGIPLADVMRVHGQYLDKLAAWAKANRVHA